MEIIEIVLTFPQNAEVTLKDGTKVNLGTWGSHMKSRLKTISSELKKRSSIFISKALRR